LKNNSKIQNLQKLKDIYQGLSLTIYIQVSQQVQV